MIDYLIKDWRLTCFVLVFILGWVHIFYKAITIGRNKQPQQG